MMQNGHVSNPAPVRRASLQSLILNQLREFVIANGVKPGDRLPSERELAARLSVSRPTLRLALNWLSEQGAVRRVQGGGTYMESGFLMALARSHDEAEAPSIPLAELVEARVLLEPVLTRLVAKRATDEQLGSLEKDLDRAAIHLEDVDAWRQHDLHFHSRLAQLADNRVLSGSLDSIVLHLPGVWQRFQVEGRIRQSYDEHRRILDALRRRDAVAAARHMRVHLRMFERALGLRRRRGSDGKSKQEILSV